MCHNIKKLDSLPRHVLDKAIAEIDRISKGGALQGKWKYIRREPRLRRFKLTRKYRMVVAIDRIREGPYLCMKHGTFDNRY